MQMNKLVFSGALLACLLAGAMARPLNLPLTNEGAESCECTGSAGAVCGMDGQDWASACEAECKNVNIAHTGACNTDCAGCKVSTYSPVCIDGQTYGSTCYAACNNKDLTKADKGECPPEAPESDDENMDVGDDEDINDTAELLDKNSFGSGSGNPCDDCSDIKDLVCGKDNVTYTNPCKAECVGVEIDYTGECVAPDPCELCTDELDPVCGKDGKNYRNPCRAQCKGVKIDYTGRCVKLQGDCEQARLIEDPVCVFAPGAHKGKTYKNGCYATADGAVLGTGVNGWRYYRGACKEQCDVRCNLVNGTDLGASLYQPAQEVACCSGGYEYPNRCYADCAGSFNQGEISRCERRFCTQGQAVRALSNIGNCPTGADSFECEKYGCVLQRVCPSNADAKCVYLAPCVKFFRLNFLNNKCGGYWLNKNGMLDDTCQNDGILAIAANMNSV